MHYSEIKNSLRCYFTILQYVETSHLLSIINQIVPFVPDDGVDEDKAENTYNDLINSNILNSLGI